MPYAANGQISQDQIEGSIEITQEQYRKGLQGILEGFAISIENGFQLIDLNEHLAEPQYCLSCYQPINASAITGK